MKAWNKPIRIHYWKYEYLITKSGQRPYKGEWGISNWMVGSCAYPWSPWLQISLGRLNIQIKYYILAATGLVSSFILGTLF